MTDATALVLLRPASGRTITGETRITAQNLREYAPDPSGAEAVAEALRSAGFATGPVGGISLSATGPPELFERYFGTPVRQAGDGSWITGDGGRELPVPAELSGAVHAVTFEIPSEPVVAP
jgi:hypothetical protein